MSSIKIADLNGKKFICVVAHQDDETLYYGGLLLAHHPALIVCVTAPWPGTPYSTSRVVSFAKVGAHVNAETEQWGFTDCGTSGEVQVSHGEFEQLVARIEQTVERINPDFILTHSDAGEANHVYPRGHAMHKIVNRAVRGVFRGDILANAMGKPRADYELEYQRDDKQVLFDYYLPQWDPFKYNFNFAMDPEKYVWIQRQS